MKKSDDDPASKLMQAKQALSCFENASEKTKKGNPEIEAWLAYALMANSKTDASMKISLSLLRADKSFLPGYVIRAMSAFLDGKGDLECFC